MDDAEDRALRSVMITVSLNVGDAPLPCLVIRPGGFTRDDRRGAIVVDTDHTVVFLRGTPEELRAFADHLAGLADDLAADEAGGPDDEVAY